MQFAALDRKLLRDLVAMKGQVIAIALVIGAGLSLFVMYLSNFDSLRRTEQAYYARQRFADVFASLKRAPESLAERIAAIPGVARVETRVVSDVVLDVPGLSEPATGRLISLPADRRPALNDLYLREGQWVSAERPDEVVASETFVRAHGFHLGDRVSAIINGRLRQLTIVGVALSPEYVYSIRPGEVVPDARRFGVFWMERRALASAFNMEGGFNDVALSLERGAQPEAVIAALDRLLTRYGGRGALPRALQVSSWTLDNELRQLQTMGIVIPFIFLLVAAFVLNVAISRALALQRPQLAALKALGYTNRELAAHYLKWALAVALLGVAIGTGAGAWLGSGLTELYNEYFHFPILLYRLSAPLILTAVAISLLAAMFGALSAVRRAVAIPPAEAMRPEPPARYRPSRLETPWLRRHVTAAAWMILRNIERHPFRAATSVLGIGFAGALLVMGFALVDAMDQLVQMQFAVAERQDVSLTFTEPASPAALYAIQRLPGVIRVEPQRVVPARLRVGPRHRNLAVSGVSADPELRRIVDRAGRTVTLPPAGLVLSTALAHALNVSPGENVSVEVLEGRQPVRQVPVVGLVDDTLGLSAYMEVDALRALMHEGSTISNAHLQIDAAREPELAACLKTIPVVAGVAFKRAVVESFRKILAQNMGLTITFTVIFAAIISSGVVYNAARVSLSERSRELASLRVLGFTRAEISAILLGELAILTVASLPIAALLGSGLAWLLVWSVESEVYRFPFTITPQALALSALVVVGAAIGSGLVVRRHLDRLDLVAVLKTRE